MQYVQEGASGPSGETPSMGSSGSPSDALAESIAILGAPGTDRPCGPGESSTSSSSYSPIMRWPKSVLHVIPVPSQYDESSILALAITG